MRPKLLDLFCGAGGCSVGYHRAGFDVSGVDIEPHPDYPYELLVGSAFIWLERLIAGKEPDPDVIHASPPCPRYSTATSAEAKLRHPDYIGAVRDLLKVWGGHYVIENVPGAPLVTPTMLCGSAFGLRARRHRLFESDVLLLSPGCWHNGQAIGVYGMHPDRPGGWLRPNGTSRGVKATSVEDAQDALGIDWMTRWEDLADAIPPAMTHLIGAQLMDALRAAA